MVKKTFFAFLGLSLVCNFVRADEYTELMARRDQLQQQVAAVDAEIAKCEKSMKGWTAATIIGSVGAVASGIGIIAQSQQVKENKKVLQQIGAEAKKADEAMEFMEKVK